jgi:hypothetical protein
VLDMGVRSAAFDLGPRGSVALPAPRHPACFPPALAAVELCPRAERPTVGWIPSPQAWKAHASTVRPGPVGRRKLGNVPSVPEFVEDGRSSPKLYSSFARSERGAAEKSVVRSRMGLYVNRAHPFAKDAKG